MVNENNETCSVMLQHSYTKYTYTKSRPCWVDLRFGLPELGLGLNLRTI